MKWLFTRPHPIADLLEGHTVVTVPVDDYPEEDEQIGRGYPLKRLLADHQPDILFLTGLGATFYARGTVLKWSGHRGNITVGTCGRKGYGRVRGCNVGANHCGVFLTEDEQLAKEHTANGRTVHWTGALAPLMAAVEHARNGEMYSRRSPRPWK